jgi:hypothetical protein
MMNGNRVKIFSGSGASSVERLINEWLRRDGKAASIQGMDTAICDVPPLMDEPPAYRFIVTVWYSE